MWCDAGVFPGSLTVIESIECLKEIIKVLLTEFRVSEGVESRQCGSPLAVKSVMSMRQCLTISLCGIFLCQFFDTSNLCIDFSYGILYGSHLCGLGIFSSKVKCRECFTLCGVFFLENFFFVFEGVDTEHHFFFGNGGLIDGVLLFLYVGVHATEGMTGDLGSVRCLMIDEGIDVESRLYDGIVLGIWEVSGDGESVEFEAFCGWNGSSVDDALSFFA